MKHLIFYIALICISTPSWAQITGESGVPVGFGKKLSELKAVHVNMPPATKSSTTDKCYIGKSVDVSISPNIHGIWDTTGTHCTWRARIACDNAKAIAVQLDSFLLPRNAQLYIYSSDLQQYLGPFSEHNNKKGSKLQLDFITSNDLYIELTVKMGSPFSLKVAKALLLERKPSQNTSSYCHQDIACIDGFDAQARSVCQYFFIDDDDNSVYTCTGALINNTALDATPYLISAAHCIDSQTEAESMLIHFNHQKTGCKSTEFRTAQSISGAELVAVGDKEFLDFAMVKLSQQPPASYAPYYAGWTLSLDAPTSITSIHHPEGDFKKASQNSNGVQTGILPGTSDNFYWEAVGYTLGMTEIGASGCPMFNQDKLIAGVLLGGYVSCSKPTESDFYSKFSELWAYYADAKHQLKAHLDPSGLEPSELTGYDPYLVTNQNTKVKATPTLNSKLGGKYLEINNLPEHIKLRFTIFGEQGVKLIETEKMGSEQSLNTSGLSNGLYFIVVSGAGFGFSGTFVVSGPQ